MVDRSKYKPVEVAILKKIVDEQDAVKGGNLEFHKLEAGANKFKILPAHDGTSSFMTTVAMSWLPILKPDGSEGKKTIFDSRYHSDKTRDMVNEYCKLAKNKFYEEGGEEAKTKLAIFRDFKTTIEPQTRYVMYALDVVSGKVALLSLSKSIRDAIMTDILLLSDDYNGRDAFTGLDDGLLVLISYNPNSNDPKTIYSYTRSQKPFVTPDEALETLETKPTLTELYYNTYKVSDLKAQMFGIAHFDNKYGFGIIHTDEWKKIVEEMLSMFSVTRAMLAGKPETEVVNKEVEKATVVVKEPADKAVAKENPVEDVEPLEIDEFITRLQS